VVSVFPEAQTFEIHVSCWEISGGVAWLKSVSRYSPVLQIINNCKVKQMDQNLSQPPPSDCTMKAN